MSESRLTTPGLGNLLDSRRIFLVSGPGGVGKTTLAASLGITLARRGHRTVVLTVDPARRLAQALGFEGFQSELQPVKIPDAAEAKLFATMLDSQRYFDRVIDRFATSPEQKEKILNHPLYRLTIDHLGGTHEYAAMERLLEFAKDPTWAKIVVDTPPTQNAVDLFAAPERLANFMDGSILRWFQKGGGGIYERVFKQGTRIAMRMLQTVLGGEFLENLGTFLDDLEGMHAGFVTRNREVTALLKAQTTAFLLVSYPTEVRFQESKAFLATLKDQGIPLAALLLNRLESEPPESLADRLDGIDGPDRDAAAGIVDYTRKIREQERRWEVRFADTMLGIPTLRIFKRGAELHNLAQLSQLGESLI